MYIRFYKVTEQARQDFTEVCPKAVEDIQAKTEEELIQETNRKMRKYCNLGKVVESKNGFDVRQYFNLLFVVKDYIIQYVYQTYDLEPYKVTQEDKDKYDFIEQKLTAKNQKE